MSQLEIAKALLYPDLGAPAGLVAWNGSDPAHRFLIYRNNYIVSLVDALADTFDVTRQLVGEEFFRAMARLYAYAHPHRSPMMVSYGADFPDFIQDFPPAAELPYLADVARLEYRRVVAYHAADVPGVESEAIVTALEDEIALSTLTVTLHPSLSVLPSNAAIASLWAAHHGFLLLSAVSPDVAEVALILRNGLNVEVLQISEAAGVFICELQSGACFGRAAAEAMTVDADFELGSTLGLLLQKSAITALNQTRTLI